MTKRDQPNLGDAAFRPSKQRKVMFDHGTIFYLLFQILYKKNATQFELINHDAGADKNSICIGKEICTTGVCIGDDGLHLLNAKENTHITTGRKEKKSIYAIIIANRSTAWEPVLSVGLFPKYLHLDLLFFSLVWSFYNILKGCKLIVGVLLLSSSSSWGLLYVRVCVCGLSNKNWTFSHYIKAWNKSSTLNLIKSSKAQWIHPRIAKRWSKIKTPTPNS